MVLLTVKEHLYGKDRGKDSEYYDSASGKLRYRVEAKTISLHSSRTLQDDAGAPLLTLRRQPLSGTPQTWKIYRGASHSDDTEVATLEAHDVTSFEPYVTVQLRAQTAGEMRMQGDFMGHKYNITQDGRTVAQVTPAAAGAAGGEGHIEYPHSAGMLARGVGDKPSASTYQLHVEEGEDVALLAAVCLVADEMLLEH